LDPTRIRAFLHSCIGAFLHYCITALHSLPLLTNRGSRDQPTVLS
jgi:hypothetical protein